MEVIREVGVIRYTAREVPDSVRDLVRDPIFLSYLLALQACTSIIKEIC